MEGIIGRSRETRVLEKAWSAAQEGNPAVVLLKGEAGVGKTWLAQHFIDRIRDDADGQRVAAVGIGRCVGTPGESEGLRAPWEAFGAYVASLNGESSLLKRIVDSKWVEIATEITSTVPAISIAALPVKLAKILYGGPQPTRVPSGDLRRSPSLLIHETFLRSSVAQPSVVFLDDLHWADRATEEFWFGMVRDLWETTSAPRLLLLATARTLEATGSGFFHRLDALAQRYGRTRKVLHQVEVSPFDTKAARALARLHLGDVAPSTDALVQWLVSHSGGSPLALSDSIRLLREHGLFHATPEGVAPVEPLLLRRTGPVPGPRVRALLEGDPNAPTRAIAALTLASLPEPDTDLLSVAALIGRSFSSEMLAKVLDRPEVEIVRSLRRLVQEGVLREPATPTPPRAGERGRYDFTQAQAEVVARSRLGSRERALYHARIAAELGRLWDERSEEIRQLAAMKARTTGSQRARCDYEIEAHEAWRDDAELRLIDQLTEAGNVPEAVERLGYTIRRRAGQAVEADVFETLAATHRLDGIVRRARELHARLGPGTGTVRVRVRAEALLLIGEALLESNRGRHDRAILKATQAQQRARELDDARLCLDLDIQSTRILYDSGRHREARRALIRVLGRIDDETAAFLLDDGEVGLHFVLKSDDDHEVVRRMLRVSLERLIAEGEMLAYDLLLGCWRERTAVWFAERWFDVDGEPILLDRLISEMKRMRTEEAFAHDLDQAILQQAKKLMEQAAEPEVGSLLPEDIPAKLSRWHVQVECSLAAIDGLGAGWNSPRSNDACTTYFERRLASGIVLMAAYQVSRHARDLVSLYEEAIVGENCSDDPDEGEDIQASFQGILAALPAPEILRDRQSDACDAARELGDDEAEWQLLESLLDLAETDAKKEEVLVRMEAFARYCGEPANFFLAEVHRIETYAERDPEGCARTLRSLAEDLNAVLPTLSPQDAAARAEYIASAYRALQDQVGENVWKTVAVSASEEDGSLGTAVRLQPTPIGDGVDAAYSEVPSACMHLLTTIQKARVMDNPITAARDLQRVRDAYADVDALQGVMDDLDEEIAMQWEDALNASESEREECQARDQLVATRRRQIDHCRATGQYEEALAALSALMGSDPEPTPLERESLNEWLSLALELGHIVAARSVIERVFSWLASDEDDDPPEMEEQALALDEAKETKQFYHAWLASALPRARPLFEEVGLVDLTELWQRRLDSLS